MIHHTETHHEPSTNAPALLVVDADPKALMEIETALLRRFGADS